MRIQLVVTGDMEKAALGASIERVLQHAGAKVTFDRPLKLGCLTTTPLPDPSIAGTPTPRPVEKMARALVNEAVSGWLRTQPDLVLAIDDLELANARRPEFVVAWVRRGINEFIDGQYPTLSHNLRLRKQVQARCSFHLLVPLAEGYFFGERAALERAGVPAGVGVHRPGADVEDFETDDPAFLPLCVRRNTEMASRGNAWWREERHPKRYLDFLVQQGGGLYDETVGGARALSTLDWPAVGAVPTAARFARSLFEDLSRLLDIANPLGAGATHDCTFPTRHTHAGSLILRNL